MNNSFGISRSAYSQRALRVRKPLRAIFVILIVFVLTAALPSAGQEINENQDSPVLKNPARVLQIEEVFRIKDNLDIYAVQGRSFFAMEEGENGTLSLVKFKIVDLLLRRP